MITFSVRFSRQLTVKVESQRCFHGVSMTVELLTATELYFSPSSAYEDHQSLELEPTIYFYAAHSHPFGVFKTWWSSACASIYTSPINGPL